MPEIFKNINYNDVENVHVKLRTLVLKGLDLSIAFCIFVLMFFEIINSGFNFVVLLDIISIFFFVFFFVFVNDLKYNRFAHVNVIATSILFVCLNIVLPQSVAVMILSLMFFPVLALVWRRFYAVTVGTAFLTTLLVLYYFGIREDNFSDALPFMAIYIFLSYFLMVITMLFKYVLRDMAVSFSTAETEIKGVIAEKDAFLQRYSHNIRTSLGSIMGIGNIFYKDVSDSQKRLLDSVTACVKNIVAIMELVDNQSDSFSNKEDVGKTEVFDLEDLIYNCADFDFGVDVRIKTESSLPWFEADAVVIRRIFMTIFDFFKRNSLGKNNIGLLINIGKVKVPPEPVKYHFDIFVLDNLEFEEFETSHYLELAEKLITLLGGNIKYDFSSDGNPFIYFNICLKEIHNSQQSLSKNNTSRRYSGSFSGSKIKSISQANVLLCEDNPINQKIMVLSLEKYVGGIDVAFNGRECLTLFNQKQYDVILMDIQMPVLDGYDTTKAIRQLEQNATTMRHTPIIAVTANTLSGDREHCLNVGMDDYFSKPFHIEKIVSRISEFLIKYPQDYTL